MKVVCGFINKTQKYFIVKVPLSKHNTVNQSRKMLRLFTIDWVYSHISGKLEANRIELTQGERESWGKIDTFPYSHFNLIRLHTVEC